MAFGAASGHQAEMLFRLLAPGDVQRHAAQADRLAAAKLDVPRPLSSAPPRNATRYSLSYSPALFTALTIARGTVSRSSGYFVRSARPGLPVAELYLRKAADRTGTTAALFPTGASGLTSTAVTRARIHSRRLPIGFLQNASHPCTMYEDSKRPNKFRMEVAEARAGTPANQGS